jgi:hypothetical protein
MTGSLGERCGFCACSSPHQLHLIADGNLAAFNHEAVEREFTAEAPVNAAGYFLSMRS